jgi:hypothetical protein
MDSGLAGCVGAGLKPAPTCILQPDSTNEISVYSLILFAALSGNNLISKRKLKAEAASRKEFDGMLASARRGLVVAQNESIETGAVLRMVVKSLITEQIDFGDVACRE